MSQSFFNHNALRSQRQSGYKGTHYALAELIDNAFDAKATRCKIILIEKPDPNRKNRFSIDEILICDNGIGMSDEQLSICLQLGGTTNGAEDDRVKNKKIGKFGFGLPSASLNQCKDIRVISWDRPDNHRMATLDYDTLMQEETINMPEILPCSIDKYAPIKACLDNSKGTIVSWKKCDQLTWMRATSVIENTEAACGQIFRHFLKDGASILFSRYHVERNGSYVVQEEKECLVNDPLFLTANACISKELYQEASQDNDQAAYYKQFSVGKRESLPTNIRLEEQCYPRNFKWAGKNYAYRIETSIAHENIQHPGIVPNGSLRPGGNSKVGQFYKKKQHHCINFVRAGREIASGSFPSTQHRHLYTTDDDKARWWSLEVSFDSDLDDLLGVHVNKQGVDFRRTDTDKNSDLEDSDWNEHTASKLEARTQLWIQLTRDICSSSAKAKAKVDDRVKQHVPTPIPHPSPIPGPEPITPIIVDPKPDRKSRMSPDERAALTDLLKKLYKQVSPEDIITEVDHFDKEKRQSIMLYASLDHSQNLWDISDIQGKQVILINTNHNFYEHYIQGLKSNEDKTGITAIELFLHSLAINMKSNDTAEDDLFQEKRTLVGISLKNYVTHLQELSKNNERA